jgi:hypothetical protein
LEFLERLHQWPEAIKRRDPNERLIPATGGLEAQKAQVSTRHTVCRYRGSRDAWWPLQEFLVANSAALNSAGIN